MCPAATLPIVSLQASIADQELDVEVFSLKEIVRWGQAKERKEQAEGKRCWDVCEAPVLGTAALLVLCTSSCCCCCCCCWRGCEEQAGEFQLREQSETRQRPRDGGK